MRMGSASGKVRRSIAQRRLALGLVLLLAGTAAAHAQARAAQAARMRQLNQAVALAEHGRGEEAMQIAQRLLTEDAAFEPAMKLKGMLLEEAGRSKEAAATYEAALKLAPNDPDLLLKTGIYQLQAGNTATAMERLARCVRLQPADGDAQFYLAQAYHLNGEDALALRAMRASLKAEPDNATIQQKFGELLCSTGDYAQGLVWLKKAGAADATLPRMAYDLGWADYNLMDLPNAAVYAERAVQQHPKDAHALQLLAMVQMKQQHWQQAKDAFERTLALRPGDAELMQGVGQCELELKDYAAATMHLQAALKLDPTLLLAHFYLSRAYAAQGKTADAVREAQLHQQMMQRMTFVRTLETEQRERAITARTRQLLKAHQEEAALRLYAEHFKGTSATPADARVFVGKTYLYMGATEDGLRALHQALAMQPTVRGAHTLEGILALKSGDLTKAESAFRAELANDPNSQEAIAELGEVRYHQGRWAEAAEQIQNSHTMTPELLYMLCDAQFHLGKAQEADLTAELVAAYGRNNSSLMRDLVSLVQRNGQTEEAQRLAANLQP
ncbi:MAG TPA: tetratricopeptide repeat protein [Terracidiphilus sp.]|nr:tetratricopeptide repeat protein [Terracidiphilus sp.]